MLTKSKALVLATAAVALALLVAIFLYEPAKQQLAPSAPATSLAIGAPGTAVEMVIFEDFLCGGCRRFHNRIFSAIRARYLELGKIRCLFIPLGLSAESKPLANAAIAVYRLAPERFVDYTAALFQSARAGTFLLDTAVSVGGIPMEALREAIATNRYYGELDQNIAFAKEVMGESFRLPAVYINGKASPTNDLAALEKLLQGNP